MEAAKPKVALITGKNPANSVRIRLQKYGATVYAAKENGVMTLDSAVLSEIAVYDDED